MNAVALIIDRKKGVDKCNFIFRLCSSLEINCFFESLILCCDRNCLAPAARI